MAASLPTSSPHPCLLHSPNLLMRNMRAEGEVLSRTTLHPHPFAHSLLNLQLSLHPPNDGSKSPPSLTQPQPYIASCTPLDPYAGAHRALAYPRSVFLRKTASSLFSHLFTALEHRQTSYRKAFGWKYADGNGVTIV